MTDPNIHSPLDIGTDLLQIFEQVTARYPNLIHLKEEGTRGWININLPTLTLAIDTRFETMDRFVTYRFNITIDDTRTDYQVKAAKAGWEQALEDMAVSLLSWLAVRDDPAFLVALAKPLQISIDGAPYQVLEETPLFKTVLSHMALL